MERTSVDLMSDAVKYLEYLQERVRFLEEQQAANNTNTESTGVVAENQATVVDEGSANEENRVAGGANREDGGSVELRLPDIEARVCNKNILLKIQCEKRKGLLVKIICEVEKLNPAVFNVSVATFGSVALDVTIVAEMEEEFKLSTNDVVTAFRSAIEATAVEN